MQFSLHTKAHTFANHTSPCTDQSMQECSFHRPEKKFNFFYSSPSVFKFFRHPLPPAQDSKIQGRKVLQRND